MKPFLPWGTSDSRQGFDLLPAMTHTTASTGAKKPPSFAEMKAALDLMSAQYSAPALPVIRINDLMCKGTGKPRMELTPQGIGPGLVCVSDKCRAETNAWMLQRFGRENVIYSFQDPITGKHTIVMCKDDYDKLPIQKA